MKQRISSGKSRRYISRISLFLLGSNFVLATAPSPFARTTTSTEESSIILDSSDPDNILVFDTTDDENWAFCAVPSIFHTPSSEFDNNCNNTTYDYGLVLPEIGTLATTTPPIITTTATTTQVEDEQQHEQCRVYFAESTIPNAGWGIFVGVDIKQDEEISIRGDAVIPLLKDIKGRALLVEYAWLGRTINAYALGMQAIPNCFFGLINVYLKDDPGDNKLDYHHYYETNNPGLGATTVHYSNSGGYALHDMQAGTEIFINYGVYYFAAEHRIQNKFGLVPMDGDCLVADGILHYYRNVYNMITGNKHRCYKRPTTRRNKQRLAMQRENADCSTYPYDDSRKVEGTVISNDLYEMTKSILGLWPNRVQGAMPSDVTLVNEILDTLGTTAKTHAARSVHSMEYLRTHGSCMDHLYIDSSKIPYAGKGAFANKFLPAGSVVAPIPLLQIPRSQLALYIDNDNREIGQQPIIHHELLLNYCFGHGESSMLFCPYGIASSLVNHPGRSRKANVKLVWSTKLLRTPEWLNMSLKEWENEFRTGLAFEYVATRDIAKGEEILLDYGIEWQQAWDNHIRSYPSSSHFKYHILNSYDPPIDLPIHNKENPIVQALSIDDPEFTAHLWCRAIAVVFNRGYAIDRYEYIDPYQPCRIVGKKFIDTRFQEYTYTAELINREMDIPQQFELTNTNHDSDYNTSTTPAENFHYVCAEYNTGVVIFNVERDIFFYGGSDLNKYHPTYLETWTFRHEIRIPDEIMPDLWKNLKQN